MGSVRGWGLGWLVVASATCTPMLPAYGEALVIIDTDAPGRLAGELRVDLYADGASEPYKTLEVHRPDPSDWPTSFSLYNPDDQQGRSVRVRVRISPLGKSTLEPPLTIDRMVRVALTSPTVGSALVVMRGACFGMPVDVAGQRECVDTEGRYEPVTTMTLASDMKIPSSLEKTFGTARCQASVRPASTSSDGTPLFDEEVCVDGGAYVFGNDDEFGNVIRGASPELLFGNSNGVPERVVRVSPFRIDKYEVTVGRFRDALAHGFTPPDALVVNEEALLPQANPADTNVSKRLCTFSMTFQDRERYPLNCISWDSARAFCEYAGGELVTEAQWEWVAQVAGRNRKTAYPWGNDPPTCDLAVYGRSVLPQNECVDHGAGPRPEDELHSARDPLGIAHLGGSLDEWQSDALADLDGPCWSRATLTDPTCPVDSSTFLATVRGGAWWSNAYDLIASKRDGVNHGTRPVYVGFRCARRAQ